MFSMMKIFWMLATSLPPRAPCRRKDNIAVAIHPWHVFAKNPLTLAGPAVRTLGTSNCAPPLISWSHQARIGCKVTAAPICGVAGACTGAQVCEFAIKPYNSTKQPSCNTHPHCCRPRIQQSPSRTSAITSDSTRGAEDLVLMGYWQITTKGRGGAEWMGYGQHGT